MLIWANQHFFHLGKSNYFYHPHANCAAYGYRPPDTKHKVAQLQPESFFFFFFSSPSCLKNKKAGITSKREERGGGGIL